MRARIVLCLLGFVGGLGAEQAPPPEIEQREPRLASVFPQGAVAGAELRVELRGEHLDRATEIRFDADGVAGELLGDGSHTAWPGRFRVSSDARPGLYPFRLITPHGATNLALFRVGDQPHVVEAEFNGLMERAQQVAVPVTINGRMTAEDDFDFYRFRAKIGETWVFDVRAARIGSALDPSLTLLDERGRRLEHSEDRFIGDPFFVHTFRKDGEYTLALQPNRGRTSMSHGYQLDVRRAPHLETVAPLGFRPGTESEAVIHGAGLVGETASVAVEGEGVTGQVLRLEGDRAVLRIRVEEGARPGPRRIALETPGGRSSETELVVEPHLERERPAALAAPVAIASVARYREPETFRLETKPGQKLVFEAAAERFGSPADLVFRIRNGAGEVVAENDDGDFPGVAFNKDPYLVFEFCDEEPYTLEVFNLWKTTGEDFPYVLRVRETEPRYELQLGDDRLRIEPDGEVEFDVAAERFEGFDEQIPIEVRGLPPGVTADGAMIPAGEKKTKVTLHASADAAPGVAAALEIAGPAGSAWRSVTVTSGGGEGRTYARVERPLLVVVEPQPFRLEAQLSEVNLVRGGTADVPVRIWRQPGFDSPLRLTAENVPEGVAAEPATVGPEVETAVLRLRATADAEPAAHRHFAILGADSAGRSGQAPEITLRVN